MEQELKELKKLQRQVKQAVNQQLHRIDRKNFLNLKEKYIKKLLDFAYKYDMNTSDLASLMGVTRQAMHLLVGKITTTKTKEKILKEIEKVALIYNTLKETKSRILAREKKEVSKKMYRLLARAHFVYGIEWKKLEEKCGIKDLWKRMHSQRYRQYVEEAKALGTY